ncbi:hypothetical protein, conserved [Eimeria tenella]|uniref:Uncharacterized protein n=1 Tax=Eimeria tenella TaxID=5802 RepID=U6KUW4_EIMTE|nr:hypothetical protein, conserved [Eimeria tenella]CDJ40149.1 hypothetical protein, conserved [Eimeria tenella]|eukprot:XP_013230902.1 hypothetical protein, conserved [Eimeria tenella]
MVLLHVKTADDSNQFLFEVETKEKVRDIMHELTSLHLKRIQTLKLADAAEALATYGPLRPEETRGLTEEVARLSNLNVYPDGPPTNPDPHFYRTGHPPPEETKNVILKAVEEAKEALSHKQVLLKTCLSLQTVEEKLNTLKGAVQIAYPAFHGLPPYEPTRLIIEGKEMNDSQDISHVSNAAATDDEGTAAAVGVMSITAENACLWWTGKQLQQEEPLSKYLGTNEKTKTVVRLQPKCAGKGPPVREPRMDAETHKAVLAYCHKRRQEEKALEEDDDDSYLFSPWANPKALKESLLGMSGQVKWRA